MRSLAGGRTFFNSWWPRSAPSLCYARNEREGLRWQRLQPTPESRAHCVAAEGNKRHFHRRNFGFLSIRRPSVARPSPGLGLVFIRLCTAAGMCVGVLHSFQTTSGCCINSHAWKHQSVCVWGRWGAEGERKFLRSVQDCQPERPALRVY